MKDNETIIWILVAVAVIFVFSGFGMFGVGTSYGYSGMMGNYGFSGMWVFGWLFMTLIFVALILFIIWLARQLQNPRRRK